MLGLGTKAGPGLAVCFALSLALGVPVVAQASAPANDGSGAFATGKYRNLFAEDGHSQAEVQAKIDSAWQQLFHGDPQTQAIAFDAGSNANGPLMYVTDWANHDVRTEGMSYGMMIAVQLGKKAEFDAIWNWAMTYMYVADPAAPAPNRLAASSENRLSVTSALGSRPLCSTMTTG